MRAFYFGCWGDKGHYLWNTNHRSISVYSNDFPRYLPFNAGRMDGTFLPDCGGSFGKEGVCTLVRFKGWTVLAFWDNSVDGRPGSNSNFILEGEWGFDEALAKAKEAFPSISARFKFPIVEAP